MSRPRSRVIPAALVVLLAVGMVGCGNASPTDDGSGRGHQHITVRHSPRPDSSVLGLTSPPAASGSPVGPSTTTYALYVATTGSDASTGSFQHPLRTIRRAVAKARVGTTIWVRAGHYAGFDVTRSHVMVSAYESESVVINAGSREDAIDFNGVVGGGIRRLIVQGNSVQYGSAVKINRSTGVSVTGSTIRNNRTFGIVVVRSAGVVLRGNKIYGNADGIEERYAGNGTVIMGNRIYANTKAVDSGRGAEGINFYKSTGSVHVQNNRLWNNGTHFEVYGASNLVFRGNETWNGQVMETGTDGPRCNNIRFVRNVGYRGSGYLGGSTNGLILRCASSSLFAHNTFDGFDKFAFDIVDGTRGVAYGGSIAGLRLLNNLIVGGRAFSIDSMLPSSVRIDYNLMYNAGSTAEYGNHLAWMRDLGQFDSIGAFRFATGFERHGLVADPRFVDRAARDYRLQGGSPAIDRGLFILSDSYGGASPDLGRYEYR